MGFQAQGPQQDVIGGTASVLVFMIAAAAAKGKQVSYAVKRTCHPWSDPRKRFAVLVAAGARNRSRAA
jgi:hypothetical protein